MLPLLPDRVSANSLFNPKFRNSQGESENGDLLTNLVCNREVNTLGSDQPSKEICIYFFNFLFPRQSQVLLIVWLLFRFSNVQLLTDVVYFDVWSDCVVRWSLAGVIICLGNCETCTDGDRGGRTSAEAKIGGDGETETGSG